MAQVMDSISGSILCLWQCLHYLCDTLLPEEISGIFRAYTLFWFTWPILQKLYLQIYSLASAFFVLFRMEVVQKLLIQNLLTFGFVLSKQPFSHQLNPFAFNLKERSTLKEWMRSNCISYFVFLVLCFFFSLSYFCI